MITDEVLHEHEAEVTRLQERISYLERRHGEIVDECDRRLSFQREAERELENFKRRVRERMIREAEARDWCSEFDAILVEFGLEPRTQNWTVTFRVDGEIVIGPLLARDEDHAREIASNSLRLSDGTTYSLGGYNFNVFSIEDTEVEVAE